MITLRGVNVFPEEIGAGPSVSRTPATNGEFFLLRDRVARGPGVEPDERCTVEVIDAAQREGGGRGDLEAAAEGK